MDAFGVVMIAVGVLTVAGSLFSSAAALVSGLQLFTGLAAGFVAITGGAMMFILAQSRDVLRQMLTLARDDEAFRKASWQHLHSLAAPPPGMPFQPMLAPTAEGRTAIPLPTRLELQDRHGPDLGAAAFEIMQASAHRGQRVSEGEALRIAQGGPGTG